ncbi:hypothetical protein NDU88_003205 [Pleurodeles waltl]|uniref:Uncharacterized protein n=1 Tax=Pleurodeles waltl TaxID=8319 RepID=A0AAV7UXU0_PLEWA|nr:hypothetical protein NDU88_003205 [Pleurodeles waltl]
MVSPTPQLLCCSLLVGRPQGGESDLPPDRYSVRVTEGCAAPCRSNRVWTLGAQQGVPKVAAPVGTGTLEALLQQHSGRLLSPGGLSTFGPCPDQAQYSSATGPQQSSQVPSGPCRERRYPAGKGAPRPGGPQRGRSPSCHAALGTPQGPAPQRYLCHRGWAACKRSVVARSPGCGSPRPPAHPSSPRASLIQRER